MRGEESDMAKSPTISEENGLWPENLSMISPNYCEMGFRIVFHQEEAGSLPFPINSCVETNKKQRTSEPIGYCGARKCRALWREIVYRRGFKQTKWQNFITDSIFYPWGVLIGKESTETKFCDGLGGDLAEDRTPLVFVPSRVKINANTYKELILEPVVKR